MGLGEENEGKPAEKRDNEHEIHFQVNEAPPPLWNECNVWANKK